MEKEEERRCRGVGVLGTGVPRSTCWKAQLRPIYIDPTSSSSTRLSTQRAQDPRGRASCEEVQDITGEGLSQTLAEHHHLIKDSYASFTTKEPAPGKEEMWPASLQAALRHQKGAACKGITASTFSSPIFAPRVDPTPPLRGHGRLLDVTYSPPSGSPPPEGRRV